MERIPSMSDVVADSVADQSSRSSKKRAKVWEFVESEVVEGNVKAVCKYCKVQLSNQPGKGTSHLNRHIGYHCVEIPQEDRDKFLKCMKPKTSDGDQPIFDPEVCRILIAKFFISAEIAFRKADDPYWVKLMNYCHPSFRVVGRQSVRADILSLYEDERHLLAEKIAGLNSHVSLTADMWSSNQNLGYLAVTAHFIDEEFELQKKIIAFKQISFPHTSYAVQDGITSCLIEWGLIGKLFTLTLDNATVNDRAARDIRGALYGDLFLRGEHLHVRCAAHVLNIMVQAGIKVIPNAITRVRDVIKMATSTPSRMQIFNSIVEKSGLRAKSGLILDVPHRWNSTYDMLHEALEYKVALNRYAAEQFQIAPTEIEWQKVEALHGFLQEFSDATKVFSACRQPTAHLFLKMLLAIRDVLIAEEWNSNELLNAMANVMYAKFEKYWDQPNVVVLIAALLDPSMKCTFLRFYYHTIGDNVEERMREIRATLDRIFGEYEKIVSSNNQPAINQTTSIASDTSSTSSGSLSGKRRVELAFAQFASQGTTSRSQQSELDRYLEDPRVSVNVGENFSVLAWWKKNSDAYPILSLMAKDFLAIPVSTVSSESAFSAAGRLLGKDRTSLAPGTLEALICSKDWFIGFTDEDEGELMGGKRICDPDEDIDTYYEWQT